MLLKFTIGTKRFMSKDACMPDGSKRPYDLEGESSAMSIRHHADGLLETIIRE